jgi:PAS domain S-box-containing protein
MPQQKRLLLVDDDDMNRDMLGRRLFRIGYGVRLASGGKQALEILAGEHIDLALLDLMMPEMSGLEVLQEIRKTRPASEFPVIVITATNESEGVVSALRAGANDYLTKPVDFAVAEARIETRISLAVNYRERRRQMELYRLASVACEEGLWDWDLKSRSMEYSPRWKAMLGLDEEEISCDPEEWFGRVHPDDRRRLQNELRAHLEGDTEYLVSEYRMRHKDGSWRWMENRAGAARDESGRPIRLAGCHTDITARRTIDPLTSLFNRAWLEGELHSLEDNHLHAAILLFALDGLERVEESLPNGGAGPFVAALAGRLRTFMETVPESAGASLVRPAEHEFAVLLRDAHTSEDTARLAARIQTKINEPVALDGQNLFAGARIGVAMTSRGEPAHALLINAHAAIRHAREDGAFGVEVFHKGMREQDIEELRIEADLRRSMDDHAFVIHYQPKVSLDDGSIRGFEALLRWRRNGAGLVQPEHFIPLAERTGLIVAIGKQVLDRACRETAELRRQYPHVTVSVNVSGRQFADPMLAEYVHASLEASGLPPDALRLEITETAVMKDPENALALLHRLHEMGVGLKLDDFGTGYSSLTYLHRFPLNTLKIDRSFVMRLPGASESVAIVRAILTLARSLQMDVVAEGVENRRQAELLRVMGCQYGQGYWYSRPVDLATLRELLAGRVLPRPERKAAAGSTVSDRAIA